MHVIACYSVHQFENLELRNIITLNRYLTRQYWEKNGFSLHSSERAAGVRRVSLQHCQSR